MESKTAEGIMSALFKCDAIGLIYSCFLWLKRDFREAWILGRFFHFILPTQGRRGFVAVCFAKSAEMWIK